MKYQVPQFIEVEDKIFGPLTLKQFIYIAGGGGFSIMLYLFLPKFLAIILILPVMAFSGLLAFYKFNNKPLVNLIEALLKYLFNPRLYLWRKEQPLEVTQNEVAAQQNNTGAFLPKMADSKLKDLTWSLDTKGTADTTSANVGNG